MFNLDITNNSISRKPLSHTELLLKSQTNKFEHLLKLRYNPSLQDEKITASRMVKANGIAKFWLHPELQKDPQIAKLARENLPLEFTGGLPQKQRIFAPTWNGYSPLNIRSCVQVGLEKSSCSPFLRDSHVTLFTGCHLIPYSFQNREILSIFMVSLPQNANHFFINEKEKEIVREGANGQGFLETNVSQAFITCYDYGIPFRRGKTCIEGGNCILFTLNDTQKAIVGELSIYLSMHALEEQGQFDKIVVNDIKEPSLTALRIARNMEIWNNPDSAVTSDDPDEDEFMFRKQLIAPLSMEDLTKFYEEARKVEAKLQLTKIIIARELELPLSDVIFMPQIDFHIDMEMFVTPEGEVVLNDHQLVVKFLEDAARSCDTEEEKALFIEYYTIATEKAKKFKTIQKKKIEVLKANNIAFRLIPAVFEAPSQQSVLNYCNGIFLGSNYITTGPSYGEEVLVHEKFARLFKKHFPKLTCKGVPGMSQFIAKHLGGIHCLTFEEALPTQPS